MTQTEDFLTRLESYYRIHGRDLPWRSSELDGSFDPYKIMVSELMLQQTQVSRVMPKYEAFLKRFPDIESLATSSLADVLSEWVGLGYNRRAKYLHQAARSLVSRARPWDYEDLVACPGIGPNTAAAILAYSYDSPVLFVETNIRTVLIHHFFADQQGVSDKDLLEVLSEVAPWNSGINTSPRIFYWAMMDYGSHLKASVGNLSKQSKTYAKQSRFHGSQRQIRGQVIRILSGGAVDLSALHDAIPDARLGNVLEVLERERLVAIRDEKVMLYNG